MPGNGLALLPGIPDCKRLQHAEHKLQNNEQQDKIGDSKGANKPGCISK